MAITGTGTQSDPFTFDPTGLTPDEVWADFVELVGKQYAVNTSNPAYGTLPENYVLDMDNVSVDVTEIIQINITYLRCNGFTIKRLRSTASYTFKTRYANQHIYDLRLEEVYSNGLIELAATGGYTQQVALYLYGLVVNGEFTDDIPIIGWTDSDKGTSVIMRSSPYTGKACGFKVRNPNGYFIRGSIANPTTQIYDATITFTGKAFSYPGTSTLTSIDSGDHISFYNSQIKGKMNRLYIYAGAANTINAEIPENGAFYARADILSSVYNTDKATAAIAAGSGLVGVTDAQLKDPEYLNSIGFDIGDNTGGTS